MKDIMSKIHLELLDKERQKAFRQLADFRKIGYLAGGTALALQINHRKSEDFDIFVRHAIDNNLRIKIKKTFGKVDFYINSTDQISFKNEDGINITFLWYYFPPLSPLIHTKSLSLASISDIVADKAQTIGRRVVWRDYVDFFFLLKEKKFTLDKIIYLAKKKFSGEFVEVQFLEQLSFFDDLKEMPIDFIDKSYSASEIKFFLETTVVTFTKKSFLI